MGGNVPVYLSAYPERIHIALIGKIWPVRGIGNVGTGVV
jgi:hypothetical protein